MTKDEFKKRWESDEDGGGITFNDAADCAVAWGLMTSPRTKPIHKVLYTVLKAAGTVDAEEYNATFFQQN
jgi:hypothetical protein